MKWSEPWLASIKHQDPYNILSAGIIKSCLIWTVGIFVLCAIVIIGEEDYFKILLDRSWIAPLFGFGLVWLLYTIEWLSPVKVDSGPKGLVRIKGNNVTGIPWELISSYQFEISSIKLTFTDSSELSFLLPDGINRELIAKEFESHSIINGAL